MSVDHQQPAILWQNPEASCELWESLFDLMHSRPKFHLSRIKNRAWINFSRFESHIIFSISSPESHKNIFRSLYFPKLFFHDFQIWTILIFGLWKSQPKKRFTYLWDYLACAYFPLCSNNLGLSCLFSSQFINFNFKKLPFHWLKI